MCVREKERERESARARGTATPGNMAVRSGFFLVVNLKRISGGRKGSFSLNSSGPNGHDSKHLRKKNVSNHRNGRGQKDNQKKKECDSNMRHTIPGRP